MSVATVRIFAAIRSYETSLLVSFIEISLPSLLHLSRVDHQPPCHSPQSRSETRLIANSVIRLLHFLNTHPLAPKHV